MMSVVDYVGRYATDVKVWKGEGGTLMLRCELPDANEFCPAILVNEKVVGVKWSSSPDEYKIHHRLNELKARSVMPCFGGATGKFDFAKLVPEQFQEGVRRQIAKNLLTQTGTLRGDKEQSIIVMPEMDFSLDKVLPFLTKIQRTQYIPIVQKAYGEAAKSLAKIGLYHGDVRARNIYLKVTDGNCIQTYIADFNSTKPLKSNAIREDSLKVIERMIIDAPSARPREKSPLSEDLTFSKKQKRNDRPDLDDEPEMLLPARRVKGRIDKPIS